MDERHPGLCGRVVPCGLKAFGQALFPLRVRQLFRGMERETESLRLPAVSLFPEPDLDETQTFAVGTRIDDRDGITGEFLLGSGGIPAVGILGD